MSLLGGLETPQPPPPLPPPLAMDTARCVLYAYRPQAETSGTAGRPLFFVPRDHLEYLLENRFTVPQIAETIDVSPRTVHLEAVSDTPARGTIHALI